MEQLLSTLRGFNTYVDGLFGLLTGESGFALGVTLLALSSINPTLFAVAAIGYVLFAADRIWWHYFSNKGPVA